MKHGAGGICFIPSPVCYVTDARERHALRELVGEGRQAALQATEARGTRGQEVSRFACAKCAHECKAGADVGEQPESKSKGRASRQSTGGKD